MVTTTTALQPEAAGGKLISYFRSYFTTPAFSGVSVKYNFIMNFYYSNYSFIFPRQNVLIGDGGKYEDAHNNSVYGGHRWK